MGCALLKKKKVVPVRCCILGKMHVIYLLVQGMLLKKQNQMHGAKTDVSPSIQDRCDVSASYSC
jgi:hypothetical protein